MAKKKNVTRKDGRIAVQIYLGRDENKKRLYKTVYGATQKEADEKALQVKLAMRKGIDVTAGRDTFAEWAERWLKIKASEVGAGQCAAYKSAIDSLDQRLGYIEIKNIRAADVQEYLIEQAEKNDHTGKPSSQQTLRIRKIAAAGVLQLAIDNRVIEYNPVNAVKLPKSKSSKKRRALSLHEQKWIENTPHRAQLPAMIMMYAGLRRGEIIPLTWADIDLDKSVIHVTKSVEKIGTKFVLKDGGKTASAVRDVTIPQRLVAFLQSAPKVSMLVSTSIRGQMHTDTSWKRMWDSYLTELNIRHGDFSFLKNNKKCESKFDPAGVPFVIPNITPHWLRHTFATMLYFAGVDVLTAMRQLGHSDIKTTLGIYTHLDDTHKAKSMSKLDSYLDRNVLETKT